MTDHAGGDEGTRTPDPLDANQMLSQLSYAPRNWILAQYVRVSSHYLVVNVPLANANASGRWWACPGSNGGPRSYQDRALAN